MSLLQLKDNKQVLLIDRVGAGISQYYVKDQNHRDIDVVLGYNNSDEKEAAQGDVLFPFPNRLESFAYEYDGKQYTISKQFINQVGKECVVFQDSNGHALHGFVRFEEWQVVIHTDTLLELCFDTSNDYNYSLQGYPFHFKLIVRYELIDDTCGFTCSFVIENPTSQAIPFGIGFHPYFSLTFRDEARPKMDEHLELTIHADSMIEFDSHLRPTGKSINLNNDQFNQKRSMKGVVLDNCFTDLHFSNNTLLSKTLELQSSLTRKKLTLSQTSNMPYLQIYTYDHSEKNGRQGVAIEPQTAAGFAFNIGKTAGLELLQPNAIFSGAFRITVDDGELRNNL